MTFKWLWFCLGFRQWRFIPEIMNTKSFVYSQVPGVLRMKNPRTHWAQTWWKAKSMLKWRQRQQGRSMALLRLETLKGFPSTTHSLSLADVCSITECPRTWRWNCHPEKTHIKEKQTYNCLICSPDHKDHSMRPRSGISKCFRHGQRWWQELKPYSLSFVFCKVCKLFLNESL